MCAGEPICFVGSLQVITTLLIIIHLAPHTHTHRKAMMNMNSANTNNKKYEIRLHLCVYVFLRGSKSCSGRSLVFSQDDRTLSQTQHNASRWEPRHCITSEEERCTGTSNCAGKRDAWPRNFLPHTGLEPAAHHTSDPPVCPCDRYRQLRGNGTPSIL